MSGKILLSVAIFSILFLSLAVNGQAFLAFMDKGAYLVNETCVIKYNQTSAVNLTGIVYTRGNSTDVQDNFTIGNSSLGMVEYSYSQTLSSGLHTLNLTQAGESVQIDFEVAGEILRPVVRLMGSMDFRYVDTGYAVTGAGSQGGNFSDLITLNKSNLLYYGNITNLTGDGRDYHFAVIDEKVAGTYDSLYVDDDRNYLLFDDSEDNGTYPFLETSKNPGDMLSIDSGNRFIISDMDTSGNRVFLIAPLSSPAYSAGDTLYLLAHVSAQNGTMRVNNTLNVSILNESKYMAATKLVTIGENGYGNTSFDLTGYGSGKYMITANETPVDVFRVESFKLQGKVTDLSDNPTLTFAPGSKVKILAISRNPAGNLISLTSGPSGTLTLPDGSTASLSFSAQANATGVYTATTSALSLTGEYKVDVSGTYGSNTERFDMGFKVQSLEMNVMTLNPKYIDEGPGAGATISAFAPGHNISAAVFMINITKGSGLKSGGPPCGNDGSSCVQVVCNNSQFSVVVKDEFGNKYSLNESQFTVMSISAAAQSIGLEPPEEPGMSDQCMVMLWGSENSWINKTGNYKLELGYSNASVGDLKSGGTFSIQKLLATGSTVDFKGDSFSFFAPNSMVRVKLEIRDLATDQLLSAGNILTAKFSEMWKEWPERKNAFKDMTFNKSQLNESMDQDKIVFTSPPEEGFYTAEFRFKANVSGEIIEGTGNIFFELKKYMIWADLQSAGEGSWFVKTGENITLAVSIMDIDMGSQKGSQAASCTGCTGLIANVSSLRNEQFFKEMAEGVDYDIITGVVTNSTSGATIVINPVTLPTGWYGLDIELKDPGTGQKYYGWGWFEIRNFWVDVFEVEFDGNYTRAGEKGMGGPGRLTVPVGGDVLLGLAAYSPPTPMSPEMPLDISGVSPQGMLDERVWPPLPVPSSEYDLDTTLGNQNITECWGEQDCQKYKFYLVNLSVSDTMKESMYMMGFGVTAGSSGTDTGSSMITVSSYVTDYVTVPETKMFEWPPVYSNSENLSMIFTGADFEGNDHNITNVTVKELYSEKAGRPVKMKFGQNYTNNCTGTTPDCQIDVYLSGLDTGEYFLQLEVVDGSDSKQAQEFEFQIKNLLFSVPRIYEGWTMDQSTPDKDLEAWYGEDRCDSELWAQWNDGCAWENKSVCTGINGTSTNLTIPDNKTVGEYFGDRFCIEVSDGGRWGYASSQYDQCQGDKFVYMVSNGTHAWINVTPDLSESELLTNGSTFALSTYPGVAWIISSFRQSDNRYIRIKNALGICGRNETGQGGIVVVVPPAGHSNYSTFYHGPSYVVGDMWEQDVCSQDPRRLKCVMNISDRPAYVYHNTTHLWLYRGTDGVNFTDPAKTSGPVAAGGILDDTYGGRWKVISISKSKISLRGQNVLANGIMVNTSLSTSGKIWVGEMRESEMGFENKMSSQKQGLDLDGDGAKNGTLYFLIIDSTNGYDKLIYSDSLEKWNFTNASRMVDKNNPDRAARQVGIGDMLTLLNIDPRADSVKFYDPSALGDWPEMGDSRIGDNVTIPVVVKSPNGSSVSADVAILHMKVKTDNGMQIVSTGLPASQINGIGELRINVSSLGYGSGRYEFELWANSSYGTEKLNEWMWPRTTIRNFLVDNYAGYGGIITDFVPISTSSYGGWDSNVMVRELFTVNDSGYPAVAGAMESLHNSLGYPPGCTDFEEPSGIGENTNNQTFVLERFDGAYYAYMTPANESIVWVKQGDCNFSTAANYTENDAINITIGSEMYMLHFTKLNASAQGAWGVIGLLDFPSGIEEIRMDDWGGNPCPKWSILSVNLSGRIYNVVFANDTSLSYPQAVTWGQQEVSKAVWMDTDGNFSDAQKYTIGGNFTADEYIGRLGPGPWEGLLVVNGSTLSDLLGAGTRPGLDIRVQDGTQPYFGKINESHPSLMLDLNKDGDLGDVFYMAAYDSFDDGDQSLTRIYLDDDLNITEPWWANSSNVQQGQSYTYYDFYGQEQGNISEQEGNVPKGMWGGNLRFAPYNQNQSWEESAEWNIKTYNGTNMILEKNVWNMEVNNTISLTVRVFDFAQNPIVGANVSLQSLMRFGGGQPFAQLNESASEFTLHQTQNVTDSNGYAMLKIEPPTGGWLDKAEYIASIRVVSNGMAEETKNWFRIGQGGF